MFNRILRLKFAAILLILSLIITPSLALTEEASSQKRVELRDRGFWQEADITFWQTLPFATLFGHFIERQFSALMFPAAPVHWNVVVAFATVVSAGNALIHAKKVTKEEEKKEE